MEHLPTEAVPVQDVQDRPLNTAKKTLMVYAVVVGVTGLMYLIYLLHAVILQLVVALIVAVALEPLVAFLMRRGLTRGWSVGLALALTVVVLLFVTSIIATPLLTQGTKLIQNAPQIVSDLTHNPRLQFFNEQYHLVDQVKELSQTQAAKLAGDGVPFVGVVGSILGGISAVAIILVFAFFFLIEGPSAWEKVMHLLRPEHARRLRRTAQKMTQAVGGFVTGNLLISLIAGSVTLVTLLLLRVPYAFALAALLAIFDLIPLVGAAIGTIVIGLVALTKGVIVAAIVVTVLLVYQMIEGHIIQPLVYSRVISLAPLLIILASVIGAELAGIIGVLLAIPVAAVIQIVVLEVLTEERFEALHTPRVESVEVG